MQDRHYDTYDLPEPILLERGRKDDSEIPIAGVVPVIMHGTDLRDWEIMVMRPQNPRFVNQPWEIGKGKRRILDNGQWRDIGKDEDFSKIAPERREPLYKGALREGAEELGLKKVNISATYDAGDYGILAERERGRLNAIAPPIVANGERTLRLYAVHIKNAKDFDEPDPDAKVAERKWMTVAKFMDVGRPDHQVFMREMLEALSQTHSASLSHRYRGGTRRSRHVTPLPAEFQEIDALEGNGWKARQERAKRKPNTASELLV